MLLLKSLVRLTAMPEIKLYITDFAVVFYGGDIVIWLLFFFNRKKFIAASYWIKMDWRKSGQTLKELIFQQ